MRSRISISRLDICFNCVGSDKAERLSFGMGDLPISLPARSNSYLTPLSSFMNVLSPLVERTLPKSIPSRAEMGEYPTALFPSIAKFSSSTKIKSSTPAGFPGSFLVY